VIEAAPLHSDDSGGEVRCSVESSDDEQIIERVAALDVGKAEIVCCIRLPAADDGGRVQEVSTHSTMVSSLCEWRTGSSGSGSSRW
jgi:transposase